MANKKTNVNNRNHKKSKKAAPLPKCPVCGAPIQMVSAHEMNFRVSDTDPDKKFWRCSHYPACDTYIAADPRTKKPSGILAGPSLRHKRMVIHHWEEMFVHAGLMSKEGFRQMCAGRIGFHFGGRVHTREMTEFECDTILEYLQKLYENQPKVHAMVEAQRNSSVWKEVRGLNTGANHGVYYNDDGSVAYILGADGKRQKPHPVCEKSEEQKGTKRNKDVIEM